jgi:uncharacterized membrane protein YfcA
MLMTSTLAGSAISGMTGLAGGTFILAVIASVVPTAYIIPLHAAVAFMSNSARVGLFRRYVRWEIFGLFVLGMLPGALIGIRVFRMIDPHIIKLSMGLFILTMVFIPLRKREQEEGVGIFVPVGFAAGLLGIFFGSIGPLIARFFLRNDISKEQLVGTKAACQTLGHLVKIPLFGWVVGANVLNFGWLLLWLGIMVLAGVFLGRMMLENVSEKTFRFIFRFGLGAIALRIVILEILALAR